MGVGEGQQPFRHGTGGDDGDGLLHWLHDALGKATRGVDLELSGLAFWDCSTLNELLCVRREALAETVAVRLRRDLR
ncbi:MULTISPECIES: hypothetical protein [Streptomyces]|uniref:hypothetical protein n=1 Tax=Streptomyces TaxID=1883 RepID=UPI00292F2D86|nr:hypothetical protein [Streptomyces sp. NEAU-HV9]